MLEHNHFIDLKLILRVRCPGQQSCYVPWPFANSRTPIWLVSAYISEGGSGWKTNWPREKILRGLCWSVYRIEKGDEVVIDSIQLGSEAVIRPTNLEIDCQLRVPPSLIKFLYMLNSRISIYFPRTSSLIRLSIYVNYFWCESRRTDSIKIIQFRLESGNMSKFTNIKPNLVRCRMNDVPIPQ